MVDGNAEARFLSRHWFNITALLVVACALFFLCLHRQREISGTLGFAMDDAWIHAAVARNFVEGKGWAIVPGKPLSVSTSPIWTLFTAFFYYFFSDPVIGTLTLSLLCTLGVVVLSYLLINTLTERPALALMGTFLILFNPISVWGLTSGMELPMVLLTLLLMLYVYYNWDPDSRIRRYVFPITAAVAAMTRPELFFALPLSMLDTFWHLVRDRKEGSVRSAILTVVSQGFIMALCLAPYFIFNKYSSGVWFPTSYYAKVGVRGIGLGVALRTGDPAVIYDAAIDEPMTTVFELAHKLINHNLIGFLMIAVGMAMFARGIATRSSGRGWLMVAMCLLLPWIMGTTSPPMQLSNHADRYYVIFPPLCIIFGCLGLELLMRWGKLGLVPFIIAALMIVSPVQTTGRAMTLLAYDVDSTERLYHQMPLWLRDNLDPAATLAVNDIGGIAYFTRRDFIDVMGLASPEIWPIISRAPGQKVPARRMEQYLRERNVQYLVLSPQYYPGITNKKEVYEPLMQWDEVYDHHRLISPQVLYKCHWENLR